MQYQPALGYHGPASTQVPAYDEDDPAGQGMGFDIAMGFLANPVFNPKIDMDGARGMCGCAVAWLHGCMVTGSRGCRGSHLVHTA